MFNIDTEDITGADIDTEVIISVETEVIIHTIPIDIILTDSVKGISGVANTSLYSGVWTAYRANYCENSAFIPPNYPYPYTWCPD